ncbi:hypothetical protein PM082_009115 [Marasmius tenuissimus]|nr:hypothetical protein PM082_009115 [Marasmius tenuissimus]
MASYAELKDLEKTLQWTFADKSRLQGFLATKGHPAQQLLDRMQQLTDYSHLTPELRPAVVTAMLRLSKNSGLHPTCLSMHNVRRIGKHPVAAGGFGDVWKGTIGDSSELVCLKVVKVYMSSNLEKLTNDYRREAILWRQLEHPNVLPFLGIYQLELEQVQHFCLISPWMEKGNLVEFLKATKREDVDHYTLVFDVASGLAYLHSKKIVHSDLKGVNILITRSERACIADFGLSRITDSQGLRVTTSATRPAGTTRWLAPELLVGSRGPSKKSDVYAFACVCCEIFTGLQPFPEYANEMAVAFSVAQGKRPSRPEGAPELSNALWALMNTCWDAKPSSRPTAGHVLEKVKGISPKELTPLASDWSESLFTQVRDNIEYRSRIHQRTTSFVDPIVPSMAPNSSNRDPITCPFPSSPVHDPFSSSEVETRVDDNSGLSSNSGVKDVSSHPDHLKNIYEAHPQVQSNGSLPTPLETDPKEQGGELTKLIGFITATLSDDWALYHDVCEHASASDSNAKEAIRALSREFKYGQPPAQLHATQLWETMLLNSSNTFIGQSTSRKFLETLEELLLNSRTNPGVKKRVLEVLAAAAYANEGKKDNGFCGLWKKVKPHDKSDEGMPFDTDDAMFNPPTGGDQRSYSESLPCQQPRLHPNHHRIGQQQRYDHQQQQHTQQNQSQPPNSQPGKTGDLLPKPNGDAAKERTKDRGEGRECDPDRERSSGRERKDSNCERDLEPRERDKDKDRSRREHRDRDRGKDEDRDLLAALGQYEVLERATRERKVEEDSKNHVGGRRGRDRIGGQLHQEEPRLSPGRTPPTSTRSPSPSLHTSGAGAPSRSPQSAPLLPTPAPPLILCPGGRSDLARPSSILLGGLAFEQRAPYSHSTPPPTQPGMN